MSKYYDGKAIGSPPSTKLDLSANNLELERICRYNDFLDPIDRYGEFFRRTKLILKTGTNVPQPTPYWDTQYDGNPVPLEFYKGLWDHLTLDKGIGLLCVIDGLDRLGPTTKEKKDFQRKCDEVRDYVVNTSNSELAAYLITMRFESHAEMFKDLRGATHVNLLQDLDAQQIIAKRAEYTKAGKAKLLTNFENLCLPLTEQWDFQFASDLLDHFLRYVCRAVLGKEEDEFPSSLQEGLDRLDKLFNRDRRKLFLALQSALDYFFQNLLGDYDAKDKWVEALNEIWWKKNRQFWNRKAYLVIEGWMLHHYRYHLPRYQYDNGFHQEYQGVSIPLRLSFIGPSFLPNIYHHVITDESTGLSLLAGIRVLQYVKARRSVHPKNVIGFITKHFSYEEAIVAARVEEFVSDGCLEFSAPMTHKTSQLSLSTRGLIALCDLAGNPDFFNLALQTVGLPSALIDNRSFMICDAYDRDNRDSFVSAVVFQIKLPDVF